MKGGGGGLRGDLVLCNMIDRRIKQLTIDFNKKEEVYYRSSSDEFELWMKEEEKKRIKVK